MNAVIGVSDDCIAAHGSDMAVAMAALDARVETVAADGATRTIPLDALYRPPGNTTHILPARPRSLLSPVMKAASCTSCSLR